LDELTSVADVHAATVRNFGAAILAEIERGSAETPVALWPPADRLDDAQLALYKTLAARVQECAAREQINATLIATRQGLQELIRTSAGPLLRGWRRTLIGAELLALRDAART
jgi:ribonuclease D